jgi:hypothetical protein
MEGRKEVKKKGRNDMYDMEGREGRKRTKEGPPPPYVHARV